MCWLTNQYYYTIATSDVYGCLPLCVDGTENISFLSVALVLFFFVLVGALTQEVGGGGG